MIKILKNFFRSSTGKTADDISSEKKAIVLKKCKKCLKKIDADYNRCPHCKGMEFYYDDSDSY